MARVSALVGGLLFFGFAAGQDATRFGPEAGQTPLASGYASCDALISAGLSERVYFPTDSEYNSSIASYWSATVQAVRPWCVIKPENTEEVSAAFVALVKTSPAGNWDIAIRGGGHSHFPSNNVAQGVTIDLSRMNSTDFESESGIVSIGPGARWGAVFKEVEKYGKSVTGGREGNVGVAGLTLGGGASFHSGKRGFTCDDIKNYKVVLADGTVVNANAAENADLYKALKGGSNNFGIVTRFDMQTFDAAPGGLYGGMIVLSDDHRDAVLKQFVRLIDMNEEHPEDTEIVTFIYSGEAPSTIIVIAANTDGVSNSTSFAPLEALPSLVDDRARKNYSAVIIHDEPLKVIRNVWFSLCFHNDIDIMTKMAELYDKIIVDLRALIPAADLGVTFVGQPLPKHYATKNNANNVLGLDESLTHNSIIWLGQVHTRTAEQEAIAHAKLAATTAELQAYAEEKGKATSWQYLNYVNPAQDPIKTYGDKNVMFLKEVAAKYDPAGVFQTRVPGGFKISKVYL